MRNIEIKRNRSLLFGGRGLLQASASTGDNRAGLLAGLFVPAIGWVAFNILGPALNQYGTMADKKRSVAIGAGLMAAAATVDQASAAVAQV